MYKSQRKCLAKTALAVAFVLVQGRVYSAVWPYIDAVKLSCAMHLQTSGQQA